MTSARNLLWFRSYSTSKARSAWRLARIFVIPSEPSVAREAALKGDDLV